MIRTLLKPLSFIPAILLMMMIYQFSAQPAPAVQSAVTAAPVVHPAQMLCFLRSRQASLNTWLLKTECLIVFFSFCFPFFFRYLFQFITQLLTKQVEQS